MRKARISRSCSEPEPNKLPAQSPKTTTPEALQTQPDIFERLKRRGIEYEQVHYILMLDVPQNLFFFARQFERRTIKEVLKHIESWKRFLTQEYVLTAELKAQVTQWVQTTEDFVWTAIRDANFQIGDWTLSWYWTPPGEAPSGERITSGVRVTATNQKTGEQRTHELPGYRLGAPRRFSEDCREIYTALGLVDQLWLGTLHHVLISHRAAQGWPAYSRMITRLYDLFAPHYQSQGHYFDKTRSHVFVAPPARYPKELLNDMLEILRMHHPNVFERTTAEQLKAAIQRHLSRKATQKPHTP